MRTRKEPPPLEEQIADYRRQFELFAEYEYAFASKSSSYERELARRELERQGWNGGHWHWDEKWDGELVAHLRALDASGFKVCRFWRKYKVEVLLPVGLTRWQVIERLEKAIGSKWVGVTFRGARLTVWWKGGGPRGRPVW